MHKIEIQYILQKSGNILTIIQYKLYRRCAKLSCINGPSDAGRDELVTAKESSGGPHRDQCVSVLKRDCANMKKMMSKVISSGPSPPGEEGGESRRPR